MFSRSFNVKFKRDLFQKGVPVLCNQSVSALYSLRLPPSKSRPLFSNSTSVLWRLVGWYHAPGGGAGPSFCSWSPLSWPESKHSSIGQRRRSEGALKRTRPPNERAGYHDAFRGNDRNTSAHPVFASAGVCRKGQHVYPKRLAWFYGNFPPPWSWDSCLNFW